jgi:hypothetical protein
MKMDKVIRNNMVAVVLSGGYGAGWFSWHGIEELLYDPVIVDMIIEKKDPEEMLKYCHDKYGDDEYFGGVDGLRIEWIPEGGEFIVYEYDGDETLWLKDEIKWMTA